MILYRPVGLEELLLIYQSSMHRFPPRLPEQPIFYPVLKREYAQQIARDWNTKAGAKAGYVTEFEIDDEYATALPVRQVGAKVHQELWVPAKELKRFNSHIRLPIRVVDAFFGHDFMGLIPKQFSLRGKNAREQLEQLREIYKYSLMDFHGEITGNHEAVFVHYPFWEQIVVTGECTPRFDWQNFLNTIRATWMGAFPDVPLGLQSQTKTRRSS